MKNVKFLLIATLCLAFSQVNLFAQADGVFGMGISYAPTEYISKTDDDSHSMEMNTINIKVFDILIPISSSNICLDMGFGALCTWGDKKKDGISNKTSLIGMDLSGLRRI